VPKPSAEVNTQVNTLLPGLDSPATVHVQSCYLLSWVWD